MKSINSLIEKYGSQRKFAEVYKLHRTQVARWVKAGALVDEGGAVWVKTKGNVKDTNKCL